MAQVPVQFQFLAKATQAQRKRVLEAIARSNAVVKPLFPNDPDRELARMFVVTGLKPNGAKLLLKKVLTASNAVKFAEVQPARRAI